MFFEKFFHKKIERKEVLEQLREEVEKLQEKKIVLLMKEGRMQEINSIFKDMNLSLLVTFIKNQNTILELHDSEIPKYSSVETIFFLSKSPCTDFELFYNIEDFKFLLIAEGEKIGCKIANALDTKEVCDLTPNDFMLK